MAMSDAITTLTKLFSPRKDISVPSEIFYFVIALVCFFFGIWIGSMIGKHTTNVKWEEDLTARGLGKFLTNNVVHVTWTTNVSTNVTTNIVRHVTTNTTRKFHWNEDPR